MVNSICLSHNCTQLLCAAVLAPEPILAVSADAYTVNFTYGPDVRERLDVLNNDKGRNLKITSVTQPDHWGQTSVSLNGRLIIYK
jgi:hypothetical protein